MHIPTYKQNQEKIKGHILYDGAESPVGKPFWTVP